MSRAAASRRHGLRRPLAGAALALALFSACCLSADLPLAFDDADKQARYETLLAELRCLVCQNQSLADSHADLAQDLRNEVYRMVAAGDDRDTITGFMVERYGDFVLYRPPLKPTTWILWAAPLVLIVLAGTTLVWVARRRATPAKALDDAERAQLKAMLEESGTDDSGASNSAGRP